MCSACLACDYMCNASQLMQNGNTVTDGHSGSGYQATDRLANKLCKLCLLWHMLGEIDVLDHCLYWVMYLVVIRMYTG